MNYTERYFQLAAILDTTGNFQLESSGVSVCSFPFTSNFNSYLGGESGSLLTDDFVAENTEFTYPVFYQEKKSFQSDVILLLHGLNERSWNKYFTWAEYLCQHTGKAVVLFPIAYHINRSPSSWSNPRILSGFLSQRQQLTGKDRSLSFANLALSERLSERPLRFFTSGRQSYQDVIQLVTQIKDGYHPLFAGKPNVDVFAYSIGAFLAQLLFMTEPLFSRSRLFLLCGGSIFSAMYGCSRSIMDSTSYKRLYSYFMDDFSVEEAGKMVGDRLANAFYSMIAPHYLTEFRMQVFQSMKTRFQGVAFAHDKVIPYRGVEEALGKELAQNRYTVLDPAYAYSHENPFPVSGVDSREVDASFLKIFNMASRFLAR
ncbi:MAG: DUF6051 family protein [Paludibacter sp.]|jgi:pimeloyl-ACP methyl ester carboxylesterase|nr:DUF6051 family protein [Paludibacter sp.]